MSLKYLQKHNFGAMSNNLLIPWGYAPQIWISCIDNRRPMNLIFPLSISFVSWGTKMDSSHLHFGLLLTLCMHKQYPVHSEHPISGRWKQGLVPKIGKCHLVEMIDTYVSSLQLIGIFSAPPKNWGCGPWKPQIKIKNQIFELVLSKMS